MSTAARTFFIESPTLDACLSFAPTGNTPGFIVTVSLDRTARTVTVETREITDGEGFQWKDHDAQTIKLQPAGPPRPTFDAGSVSHGTLRTQDLLSAFMGALESFALINGDYFAQHHDERDRIQNAIGEAQDCYDDEGEDIDPEQEDAASELVNETLPDLLNDYAPKGYSFNSHEGDGSDFGFWQCMNEDA